MSTTSMQNRQPKYAAGSAGGQYAGRQYTDPGVSLTPGRTTFSGYDLRKYRVAGQGTAGLAWTATVYRDNQEAVVITDDGNGEGPQFTGLGSNMNRSMEEVLAFKFLASELFEDGDPKAAPEQFARMLQFSAEIDRHSRANGITRPEAVWDYVQSEELTPEDAPLFINGYRA